MADIRFQPNVVVAVIRFQPKACDGCHDLMQENMRFNGVE